MRLAWLVPWLLDWLLGWLLRCQLLLVRVLRSEDCHCCGGEGVTVASGAGCCLPLAWNTQEYSTCRCRDPLSLDSHVTYSDSAKSN
jgi:hypothetical protein